MKKLIISALVAASAVSSASAVEALWMRDINISPDGKQIAFTYKGDIWTVPVTGGEAKRITTLPSYEASPVWSPDGKQIAFASDRNGSLDVYIVPATGGTATRLTYNQAAETPQTFTPDGKYVVYDASIQDPVSSVQFPSSRMVELYQIPVGGGAPVQINAAPMLNSAFSPDGSFILYEDYKGVEDQWRKHHTSSVTRDIWRYDAKTNKYTNLTSRPGEDRNPVLSTDGKTVYFLSERNGGTMNVYSMPLAGGEATAVTSFKSHPVRFLSKANNGLMAMGYNGEIYTMQPGGKPAKVNVNVTVDEAPQTETLPLNPTTVAVSPDGKQIAFISRGDVFVSAADHSSVKQITDTPQAERWLTWSSDGKKLVYTSERDGHWNLYQAELGNESDPNFSNATTIKETALFSPKDKIERTYPSFSPDGKTLAFIQDRNKIMLMDLKSKKVRQLTDGSTVTRRSGGVGYDWSPDSKWLLTTVVDRKHDPYYDIAIINVADGKIYNLTNSGYSDGQPRWSSDGNVIYFTTERYGMRSHASWGSQDDLMAIFLNREAFDRFNLNEEDLEIMKEEEKKAKKDEKDAKDKKEADKKNVKKEAKTKDIVFEPEGIERRTVRLTPFSSSISDFVPTKDGETIYFTSRTNKGSDLWKIVPRKDEIKIVQAGVSGGMDIDKEGRIYILGRGMKRLDPKSDRLKNITINGTHKINHDAERAYMFDYVRRQEREMFYDKNMHGVDWAKMTDNYERFVPHINNNYDFAEMLSELLGELNVSHTGARYRRGSNRNNDFSTSLGLLYDMKYTGNGLKVEEIVAGGPFDKAASKLKKGDVIVSINGKEITPKEDVAELLNNKTNKKTLVGIKNPATGETWTETVRPISLGAMNDLMYQRWIEARAKDVDRWSNGRLGYVHIDAMNDAAFRPVYSDLLGKYNDREGVVVDIRHNGGGRMHEDIEVLLSGKKYLTQIVRGKETCDMPSRRWNKPSIMVTNEACYSNAHGTPWVYQTMGLGKVVGAPVPGTMTSVNWVTMQDPTMVFGIPVVGYRTAKGNYLENTQLEPDIEVLVNPEDQINGTDVQLKAAVEALLKDIDAKKK